MSSERTFLLGVLTGGLLAFASGALGLYVASCQLYTRPEPYTPPPLVLQGTPPLDEDAGS